MQGIAENIIVLHFYEHYPPSSRTHCTAYNPRTTSSITFEVMFSNVLRSTRLGMLGNW